MDAPNPTSPAALDAAVARVKEGSATFARLSLEERLSLLDGIREGYRAIAEPSVAAACRAKGIGIDSPLSGEEWLAGPVVTLRNLRLLAQSLSEIKRHGAPLLKRSWMRTLADGRLAVRVYPTTAMDATLIAKHTAEAYLQPGITADNLREHQASFYRNPHGGKVCAVLGAGNVNAIPPTDCVYKMFVEGKVCVLKVNPVNAYLGPFLEHAFGRAIERGFFAVVYGGAEEGARLVQHPGVDEVHITGSDKTHDRLVWGEPGPERDARRRRNESLLSKPITSELGNVSPILVVPGPFSDDELAYQAASIAGMVANNAAFNCTAAKLLVTSAHWDQRGAFLDAVAQGLAKAPARAPYYPGAAERWRRVTEGRSVRLVGAPREGELPYALIPDLALRDAEPLLQEEPWCAVLAEAPCPASGVEGFLEEAVKLVNERVWGTLCATLIVPSRVLKDTGGAAAVEQAIARLRYGQVTINTWAGVSFGLGTVPWGAHPSSSLQDIQSGRGWVHNTLMLEDVEKAVLRAPAKAFPVAPWFPGHRSVHHLAKRLLDLELDPSWLKVPGLAAAAMRA